ncbi:hypothetical protein [Bartonella sp. DGB2]|uniref:hypothetical protein n=1 Tax=Bartonella sp. DGB2 TaxID=3388426 RepID=UPI00398FCAE9
MPTDDTPFAISGISDPKKIRVLLYANDQLAHVPLLSLTKTLQMEIDEIKKKIDALKEEIKEINNHIIPK